MAFHAANSNKLALSRTVPCYLCILNLCWEKHLCWEMNKASLHIKHSIIFFIRKSLSFALAVFVLLLFSVYLKLYDSVVQNKNTYREVTPSIYCTSCTSKCNSHGGTLLFFVLAKNRCMSHQIRLLQHKKVKVGIWCKHHENSINSDSFGKCDPMELWLLLSSNTLAGIDGKQWSR